VDNRGRVKKIQLKKAAPLWESGTGADSNEQLAAVILSAN
jgi:hypothetical protein